VARPGADDDENCEHRPVSIEVNNESGVAVEETEIVALARHVLAEMRVHPQAELSVVLVDETAMEQLHVQWMDEPGPTDVLSFPMDELRPGSDEEESPAGLLGDVVLCPHVAARQAETAGHTTQEELLLLTTHGILHLLGYDHAEPDEEKEMFALQRRLLLTFLATRGRR
jgi:probable rRNA maturation factor